MKKIILALTATTFLTAGVNVASAQEATSEGWNIGGVRIANPIEPSTWWDASEGETGAPIAINFMDPEFYINIINPKKHSAMHGGFTNPETWAQFMKAETYVNMMDYSVWAKWIEAKTYEPLLDLQTYAYWMQPGAFAHQLNTNHYAKLVDLKAYGTIVDAALGNFGYSFNTPADALSADDWKKSVEKTETTGTDS